MSGWVYFIGEVGNEDYVKIGLTRREEAEARRKKLQTGNPRKLEVLLLCKVDNAHAVERDFHQLFSSARAQGEWFRRTPGIQSFIVTLRAAATQVDCDTQ